MANDTLVIDTPDGLAHWQFMSRLFGLALETNTDGMVRSLRIPVLAALHLEYDMPKLRNTQANRGMVLRHMVNIVITERPDWAIPSTVERALLTDEQRAATR